MSEVIRKSLPKGFGNFPTAEQMLCRQGRRLCPRNGTEVKCSCFDKPNRLVKTDIGWRQSKGALFERFHKVFTE